MAARRHDPIRNLEMYAEGDAVGLGFMTRKEFDDPGLVKKTKSGSIVVRPSGRQIALELIPPAMRFAAEKELGPYRESKRASITTLQGPDGQPLKAGPRVTIVLPDNGRSKKP